MLVARQTRSTDFFLLEMAKPDMQAQTMLGGEYNDYHHISHHIIEDFGSLHLINVLVKIVNI